MIKMIGQEDIKKEIRQLVNSNFPRTVIIHGLRGGGRKLLAQFIANQLEADHIVVGIKVDEIREAIELMTKNSTPTVYVFPDIQEASLSAKNALLKIMEEPPAKSYIVLTTTDTDRLLPTLISRSRVIRMQDYWDTELIDYMAVKNYKLDSMDDDSELLKFILGSARVPGEMDRLFTLDITEFYNFMIKVVNNIAQVKGTNALKISSYLSFKESAPGYDLALFFRAFIYLIGIIAVELPSPKWANEFMKELPARNLMRATGKTFRYLYELQSVGGLYQLSTFDVWVLAVRAELNREPGVE